MHTCVRYIPVNVASYAGRVYSVKHHLSQRGEYSDSPEAAHDAASVCFGPLSEGRYTYFAHRRLN